ncbi:MAG TPA: phosphatase PAP2 family protein [Chitinophagaceae bacterium]|nr:phosphatase PAP2 family protein [Chitinophagaceae bacterium]
MRRSRRNGLLLSFCFLLITFSTIEVKAQESRNSTSVISEATVRDTSQPYYYRINKRYFSSIWDDFKQVAVSPLHWQGKDWAKFGVVMGGAAILTATADKPVKRMMLRNQKPAFKSVTDVFEPLGNRFGPLFITGMYLTGVISGNRRIEHASLSITRSLLISTVIYTASKAIINRQRPVRTDNPYDFRLPFTKQAKTYTSFPSGHSNTIFSIATACALEFKNQKWVPFVAYSIATLTAVSRVYQNRHWTSDILVGASLGHFITKKVYAVEEKKRATLKATY